MVGRRLNRTEQNRTYKIHIVKEKHEIITHWIKHMIDEIELLTTDIITLINKSWVNTFSEVESNIKYILERGWFPYKLKYSYAQETS